MTELTGVGQELAAAREARGLALADVAQQLKFAARQLEALEQEHFEALPGATFTRGMVRAYARLLKLDPEPLVQRIAGRFELPDSNRLAARYYEPVPFTDGARRSTFVYLAMSLGVLVLVAGVAYEWHQERTAAAKKASSFAKAKPAPRVDPTPQPAAVAVVEPAAVPAPPPPAIEKAPVKTAEPPTPKVAGRYRLVVRTEEEAWIEIKDSADRMLVSSLNPPGSEVGPGQVATWGRATADRAEDAFGFAALGRALENAVATPYEELVVRRVCEPLGLAATSPTPDASGSRPYVQGHKTKSRPVPPWDLGAFVPAGGLRSSAADMLGAALGQDPPPSASVPGYRRRLVGPSRPSGWSHAPATVVGRGDLEGDVAWSPPIPTPAVSTSSRRSTGSG
jgi:cytoskeleton protein RodZ